MKFLLIYPPPEPFFIKKTRLFYGLSPPLGLLYVAKMLENDGDSVTIFDFSAEPFDQHKLITEIRLVDAVGITVISSSFNEVKNLIHLIRQQNPNLPILIGGPHCSLLPERALEETQADICIQGDGEAIITDIKQAFNSNKDFSEIPGVTFRAATSIKHGPPTQLIHDLNTPSHSPHVISSNTIRMVVNTILIFK
jgi:radical SAM superfamily enzyme YgiQ (UPF0313 family)